MSKGMLFIVKVNAKIIRRGECDWLWGVENGRTC